MPSCRELLQYWERRFAARGVDSPRLSVQILLAHVLRLERLALLLDLDIEVPNPDLAYFVELASRREGGEPVAYLTGTREFYGLDLHVTPDVLIPRPETELMIDHVRDLFGANDRVTILDIGTGSGAVAIACATCFPQARVVGLDISRPALRVARMNARRLGVADQVDFVQADLVDPLHLSSFRVLLANLPYVPMRTFLDVSLEVRGFEPHLALFSGEDGLDCYRRLAHMMEGRVAPGTMLCCEIDPGQGEGMRALFASKARNFHVFKDYSGHDRMAHVVF